MSNARQCIVCFGQERMLLHTRLKILLQARYEALGTRDLSMVEKWLLDGKVSILVLCHTTRDEDAEAISRFLLKSQITVPMVRFSAGWWKPAPGSGGVVCDSQKGPAAFLAAVREVSTGSDASV